MTCYKFDSCHWLNYSIQTGENISTNESTQIYNRPHGTLCTQGLIEILGFMVIFDENQGVSDLSKFEFLGPIYVKIIMFLVI